MTDTLSDFAAAFAEQGPIQVEPLSKIQKLGGRQLARNWQQIPHVFHQDEADVTQVEAARLAVTKDARPSLLAMVTKAVAATLKDFPRFNSSLDAEAGLLVLKAFVNMGFAIDTPNGLVVGVVPAIDDKTPRQISEGVAALAGKARGRGLGMSDMTGGTFTISSLGAAGGTGFTPIINSPEVAILGLSRLIERPIRTAGGDLAWRLMLPLSLSYDHRVINGADAAAFMTRLRAELAAVSASSLAGA